MDPRSLEVISLKRILGERLLFDGITFKINKGDRLFVTGPSGVGKTLLLRLLACLDESQVGGWVGFAWQDASSPRMNGTNTS